VDPLPQDLRFAVRRLLRRPAFTALAVGMLALGIGANTGIFSVLYTVLLRPIPFPEPERLVHVWETRAERGWMRASVTPANFWDLRAETRAFVDLGAFRSGAVNLSGAGFPERLQGARVTAGFFTRVLGVSPVIGRDFLPGEDQLGGESRIVLLSHTFWRARYGANAPVLGTRLTLDGNQYTVVGVMPPGTPWLDDADLFLPMVRRPDEKRGSFELPVVGRIKPGMSREAAVADLQRVAWRLAEAYPAENRGMGINTAGPEIWYADAGTRRAMWVLLTAVGLLLLTACANLANLLLAQATGRARETAIRTALGASRGRLLRQGLTESLLLALLGAALGLVLAAYALQLARANPFGIPRMEQVDLNPWVLLFTLGAALFTGAVTGLLPALQARGSGAATTLRSGGAGITAGRGVKRVRGALVAGEVALSLVLLIGAGLLVRSFSGMIRIEPGFEPDRRLVASVSLPGSYGPAETNSFLQQFLGRVRSLPGVRDAGATSARPMTGNYTSCGVVRPGEGAAGEIRRAQWRYVTPGYFAAMGIPLQRGRFLGETDVLSAEPGAVNRVVISERLAEQLWPGENPVGRTAIFWAGQGDHPGEIAGVVGDIREEGLDGDPTPQVYLPYYGDTWSPVVFVVHTAGDPTAVVAPLRAILRELDPQLPLSGIRTLNEVVGRTVATRRFVLLLVGLFATVALALAMAGVYGVQAYTVAGMTNEIGVRVVLGASSRSVLRRVVTRAMRPAAVGIVVGLAGAFALSRLLASLLFRVRPSDPPTYLAAAVLLALTALVSCWLPARQVLKVDPVTALRAE
jgi:putative ABC transport system permease protein